MTSLRSRLITWTLAGITLFLAAGGFLIYSIVETRMRADLDSSLRSMAQAAGAAATKEIERLLHQDQKLVGIALPIDAPGDWYQLRLPDGQVISNPSGLDSLSLPPIPEGGDEIAFADVPLASGQMARAVGLRIPGDQLAPRGAGPRPGPRPPRDEAERERGDPRAGPGGPGGPGDLEGPDPKRRPRPRAERPEFEVVVARDLTPMHETLGQLRTLLLASWALACLGCGAILFSGIRRGLRPVTRLGEQLEALDAADLRRRFELADAPDELVPVIQQLDAFVDRIDEALTREKSFSANAAHELRTPLAGLRSTVELALLREREPEEYRASARQVLAITEQMQGLVEQLLDLARPPAPDAFESTGVRALLDRGWAECKTRAEQRGIELDLEAPTDLLVTTEPDLAQRVVSNLLENAASYADEGTRVAVSAARDGERVAIRIANRASQAPADIAEHAFELFWRADEARSIQERHCGLGLPLCRQLTELLGGSLTATFEGGTFEVQLVVTDRR